MKFAIAATAVITTTLALTAASGARADEKLAAANNCLNCHQVDRKVLGPAFKDVANKYRGNKDAQAILFKKVKEGGKGTWGEIPMPANTQVKDADISTLVQWILSLK